MPLRVIDVLMSITQSQNLKPIDPNHTVKSGYAAQLINEQNSKNKESIARIPEQSSQTEIADMIKHGMGNDTFQSSHHPQQSSPMSEESSSSPKALLDDKNGNSIDIFG
ncbi:MAG: hypothetical protein ACRCTQ_06245 [Brevinemataceae bacterium]